MPEGRLNPAFKDNPSLKLSCAIVPASDLNDFTRAHRTKMPSTFFAGIVPRPLITSRCNANYPCGSLKIHTSYPTPAGSRVSKRKGSSNARPLGLAFKRIESKPLLTSTNPSSRPAIVPPSSKVGTPLAPADSPPPPPQAHSAIAATIPALPRSAQVEDRDGPI